jgi:RNA polymerase primary sigma factor
MIMSEYLVQQAGQYKPLTPNEQRALAQRAQSGDNDARDQLVLTNLRLVIKIVKDFPQFISLHFDEMYQAGVVGLLNAIDHYDLARGTAFSTCAVWWIHQSIRIWIYDQNTIYVPRYLQDASIKVAQAMRHDHHTVPELVEQTGLKPSHVQSALDYLSWSYVSVDSYVKIEDGYTYAEVVPDTHDDFEALEDEEQANAMRAEVKRLLALLSPQERLVTELRYGLTGLDAMKLAAIARTIGTTTSTVGVLLHRAMGKMRAACTEEAIAS